MLLRTGKEKRLQSRIALCIDHAREARLLHVAQLYSSEKGHVIKISLEDIKGEKAQQLLNFSALLLFTIIKSLAWEREGNNHI